ncbi:hypothetical protein Q3V94_06485 [Caloramator sp. CAR-1]|jgi:hypothetical protein|uniref:hypothetical protein n=1 Tax=Caloramator sp. CAR-1 TaxID=3062777 RepID=UPI0026E28CA8|nr:hypothetical protein [Caloramator sp. CAR-1]MDO6354725.1 hypothetical protein [Caloramator sp. CAR-1]
MRKKLLGFWLAVTLLLTSFLTPFLELVNAAPKAGGGGFKSGSFKSSPFNSGGFKSGTFKSTPKYTLPLPKSYQRKSYTPKNYIPIPVPWGGFWGSPFRSVYTGFVLVSLINFIFKIIVFLLVLYIIFKIFRR